jgi:MoaA/NifB/PqqE/SkfB family radical SAM enzyme
MPRRTQKPAPAVRPVIAVAVGGGCNNACAFCRRPGGPSLTVEDVVEAVRGSPGYPVVIGGPGEPLIHPQLDRLIHAARRAGAGSVILVTNGRMLASGSVARRVAALKPDIVVVSLHAARRERHEAITKTPQSFDQTLKGLGNLLALRGEAAPRTYLRLVLLDENRDQVAALLALVRHERLDGLIVDDAAGPGRRWVSAEIEALRAEGHPISSMEGFEQGLRPERWTAACREGMAPVRLPAGEGAVSLVLRSGCRNACLFCTTRIVQEERAALWPNDDVTAFYEDLRRARAGGARSLRIVAVEPIEHPQVDRLIAFAREKGYTSIEAWTSARGLAEETRARTLKRAGLTAVDVPLMGATARTHDLVAGSRGAFDDTLRGLRCAVKAGLRCKVHFIVVKQNLDDLLAMARLVEKAGLGAPGSLLIPSPSSAELDPFRAFMPSYGEVMAALGRFPRRAAARLLSRGLLNNIPACVILGASEGYGELLERFTPVRESWIRDGSLDEPGAALKLRKRCAKSDACDLAGICVGYHDHYERLFGLDEFRPVQKRTRRKRTP